MHSSRSRGFKARIRLKVALLCAGFAGAGLAQGITSSHAFTASQPAAPTGDPGAPPSPPQSKIETAEVARGSEIYFSTCMPCHGNAGQGGPGGGMPFTDALTVDSIATILRTGRNTMPEFGSVYTPEEIEGIAHFVMEKLLRK